MAEKDSNTTIEGKRQGNPPAGCVFVCLMCRQKVAPGENLCSACKTTRVQIESSFDESMKKTCEALKELRDMVVEIRGLAKVVKAGKVPGVRRINRIAADLARWENGFNSFVLEPIMGAIRYGQMKQFIH